MTTVVNRRIDSFDVYIGRGSKWGNPFIIGKDGDRAEVIEKYRYWLIDQVASGVFTKDEVVALRGKRLGCYCAPLPCHGDVLAEYAEFWFINGEVPF